MSASGAHSLTREENGHPTELRFDYANLSPSVEKFLRGQAIRIRRHCASSIIQIGRALLEAKRHLSHGEFLRWVELEVGIPARTSQGYMRVAHWTLSKSATVAHLPPSALYVLSSSAVPEEFVSGLLERVGNGEQISPSAMRQELKAFRLSNDAKSSLKEVSSPRVADNPRQDESPIGEVETRCPIAELAALLAMKLPVNDFARVCELITSDSILGDPALAEKLARQFRPALQRAADIGVDL